MAQSSVTAWDDSRYVEELKGLASTAGGEVVGTFRVLSPSGSLSEFARSVALLDARAVEDVFSLKFGKDVTAQQVMRREK